MTQQMKMPSEKELRDADDKVGIVHMINGKTGKGENFYAYISVRPSRYEDFVLISRAKEQMDLHEFGEILESGFGNEPPADVRRMMEEKYGVDHNFLGNLQKEVEKQQAGKR